jgi:hypothetical protein
MTSIELQAFLKQYPDDLPVYSADIFKCENEEITGMSHQQSGQECLILYRGDYDK